MSSRFLHTQIQVANIDEVEKKRDQFGREPEENELETVNQADTVFDLLSVYAVRQSFYDGKLMPEQCVLYVAGEPDQFTAYTPYDIVRDQWLALHSVEPGLEPLDISYCVKRLAEELGKDQEEGSLYFGYQSNIAMSFVDVFQTQYGQASHGGMLKPVISKAGLNSVANEAAKHFLNMLINSVKGL